MEQFIGEIKLVPYTYAPAGWAPCDGRLLQVSTNALLFSLLGTVYGGDGQTTFGLPDLRGRAALASGQAPGLSNYPPGELTGVAEVVLDVSTIPAHAHALNVSKEEGTLPTPGGNFLSTASKAMGRAYGDVPSPDKQPFLGGKPIAPAGADMPHTNYQPYLVLKYIIALEGVFPQHPTRG